MTVLLSTESAVLHGLIVALHSLALPLARLVQRTDCDSSARADTHAHASHFTPQPLKTQRAQLKDHVRHRASTVLGVLI